MGVTRRSKNLADPGTKKVSRLEENAGAASVHLAPQELSEIDPALPPGAAAGPRSLEAAMKTVNR